MKKIRLLLIEDNRLLREGITEMIKSEPDLQIVGASGNYGNGLLRKVLPEVTSVRVLVEQIQLISRKGLNVIGDDVVK